MDTFRNEYGGSPLPPETQTGVHLEDGNQQAAAADADRPRREPGRAQDVEHSRAFHGAGASCATRIVRSAVVWVCNRGHG